MRIHLTTALAGASLIALAGTAQAQTAEEATAGQNAPADERAGTTDTASVDDGAAGAEEIIVTARRRDELLQDVPLTVDAVSGNTIQELNIERFEDVQAIVPGLSLTGGNTGYSTGASIRGASFQAESSTSPTVEFYLNEALIQSTFLFQSMFDVGQIEVLRGPQGTLRGRAAPSGSITVTTRRPDLAEFGGYVDASTTTIGSSSINGALNIPIVTDMLAIRVSGVADETDGDEVRSINSTIDPYVKTKGYRASLRFEPSPRFAANIMYQDIRRNSATFPHVESISEVVSTIPPSGRILEAEDRLSIYGLPTTLANKQRILTGQVDYSIVGQKLSYVGSWSKMDVDTYVWESSSDLAQVFPALDSRQPTFTTSEQATHELRLANEDRLFGMLDYTVGAFRSDFSAPTDLEQVSVIANGTTRFTPIVRRAEKDETSIFGNLTLHFGENTELSGGVRHITFKTTDTLNVAGRELQNDDNKFTPTIYNASLSHRFSDDFMVYANTGSSWRPGATLVGVFRPLTPRLAEYTQLDDEKSKSYEVGFKSSFLDNKVRLNVAAFQQDFDGYIYRGNSVYYVDQTLNPATGAVVSEQVNQFNFGSNLDARIRGVDADITFQPSRNFSFGADFSYAKGKIQNDFIACNDLNGDGIPDASGPAPTVAQIRAGAGGEEVAQCQVSNRTAFAPDWTLTLQSEYSLPVSDATDGFVRGLFTYYPESEGDESNPYDDSEKYGLLNLYAGLRDTSGAWELSFFARNLLDTGEVLSRGNRTLTSTLRAGATTSLTVPSSYINTRFTAPREFGVNLRYAFGSR